jgi:hypothetical protein
MKVIPDNDMWHSENTNGVKTHGQDGDIKLQIFGWEKARGTI